MSLTPKLYETSAVSGLPRGVYDPYTELAPGVPAIAWTGAYPWIDQPDEFTAYGAVDYPESIAGLAPSFAVKGPLTLSYQVRCEVGTTFEFYLLDAALAGSDLTVATVWHGSTDFLPVGGFWVTGSFTIPASSTLRNVAAAGNLLAALIGGDNKVSYLDLTGGVTFLRNHRRTDGLGGNAPRNHRKDSIQGSLRNHGYR